MRIERDRSPLAGVVRPTSRRVIDAERLEHEALVGRWALRLIPVGCVVYIAARLGGALW